MYPPDYSRMYTYTSRGMALIHEIYFNMMKQPRRFSIIRRSLGAAASPPDSSDPSSVARPLARCLKTKHLVINFKERRKKLTF